MVHHLVNYYVAKDAADKARNDFAEKSWQQIPDITTIRVHDSAFTRSSKDLGDERPVPYVKDLIGMLESRVVLNDDDVIMLTNMDTILHTGIKAFLHKDALYYGCRRELEKDVEKPLTTTQISKLALAHESSADVFIFTFGWWKEHKDKYPDMLLGCQWWDTCMIDLMESTKKKGDVIRITNHIYHRTHNPFWFSGDNMFTNPGQIHNRKLSREWVNPNKKTKFDGVKTWEDKLGRDYNKVEHKVVVGKATYYF